MSVKAHSENKIVYLFQGGGSLGSYQAGVFEGLSACNRPPDWLIGTSIGAINAAIIAGNQPEHRVEKLQEFWSTITSPISQFMVPTDNEICRKWQNYFISQWTLMFGLPGFFKPRVANPWVVSEQMPDTISFYDTSELYKTLTRLIDFDLINQKKVRLTLAAVCIEDNELTYFDNTKHDIGPEHIMASGALPPGFPAVKINNKYYWDGGISSNTPLEAVLLEKKPEQFLCFVVNLFSSHEAIPHTMFDVLKRRKDIEFAGRYGKIIDNFCKVHSLEHTINHLRQKINVNQVDNLKKVSEEQVSTLNVIRFHYRDRPYDLWSKDFNFSKQSINEHYQAGLDDVQYAVSEPNWLMGLPAHAYAAVHNFQ